MSDYKTRIYEFVKELLHSDLFVDEEEQYTVDEVYQKAVSIANKLGIELRFHEELFGTVKFFIYPSSPSKNKGRGYGFIIPDTPIPGYQDCDVYVNSITAGRAGIVTLPIGTRVAFTYRIDKARERPYATRIRILSKEEDPKAKESSSLNKQ